MTDIDHCETASRSVMQIAVFNCDSSVTAVCDFVSSVLIANVKLFLKSEHFTPSCHID